MSFPRTCSARHSTPALDLPQSTAGSRRCSTDLTGAENLAAPMPDPFTERGWYKWLSLITFLVGLGKTAPVALGFIKQNPFVAPCLSWFIETVFSNGLNLFFLIKDGVRMENDNTIFLGKDMNYVGTFSNTCISVIDMIAISLLWVEKPFELQDLGLYLPMFPGLTKFAMLKGALKPNPWLVALCPAIDGIFYGLSCMYLGFTLPPLPPHEEFRSRARKLDVGARAQRRLTAAHNITPNDAMVPDP